MLTAINNARVNNKKVSKIYIFYVLQVIFFGMVFVSSTSIILSDVITESSIILAKYFQFSQKTCTRIPNVIFFTYMMFFTLT